MNKALVGIAVAVAVLAGVMLLRDGSDGSRKKADAPSAPSAKTSTESVLSIAPGVKREPPSEFVKVKPSPLIQEWRATRDLKPIYDRLRQLPNPTAEESFVLASILEECGGRDWTRETFKVNEAKARFAASLSAKAPHREKRIEAFVRARRNDCVGFEKVQATPKEIRELFERAAAAGEPKAQARVLSFELNDARRDGKPSAISDEQIARMKSIVASGDPRAIIDVVSLMTFGNWNFHLRGPDEAPIDPDLLQRASTLAACELGYPCGPESPEIASACAFHGYCDGADYRDYLLFYELSPGAAQRAMLYQAQLLRAVREGDWSYFTFQRGPGPDTAAYVYP